MFGSTMLLTVVRQEVISCVRLPGKSSSGGGPHVPTQPGPVISAD